MTGDIVNIVPVLFARRIAGELMRRRGPDYFTLAEPRGPSFRLDPGKIELVVELARRDATRFAPALPPSARDLCYCRRQLRRDVIRQVTTGVAPGL